MSDELKSLLSTLSMVFAEMDRIHVEDRDSSWIFREWEALIRELPRSNTTLQELQIDRMLGVLLVCQTIRDSWGEGVDQG